MSGNSSIVNLRLKSLIDASGKTRKEIATNLKCDISTVTKHYSGDRDITTEYVIKYAKYFNVSADYLLGLSEADTDNKDVQFVCDYTGLNKQSVDWFHGQKRTADFLKKALGTESEYNGKIIELELSIIDSMIMLDNGSAFIKKLTGLTVDCLSTVGNIVMDKNRAIVELVTRGPSELYSSWLNSADERLEKYHMILFRAQNAVMDFLNEYCKEEIEEWNQTEGCLNKIDLYLKQSVDRADYDLDEIRKIGEEYGFYPKEE